MYLLILINPSLLRFFKKINPLWPMSILTRIGTVVIFNYFKSFPNKMTGICYIVPISHHLFEKEVK